MCLHLILTCILTIFGHQFFPSNIKVISFLPLPTIVYLLNSYWASAYVRPVLKTEGTVVNKHDPGPSGVNSLKQRRERLEARNWVHSTFSFVDAGSTST